MPRPPDAFTIFDPLIEAATVSNPWNGDGEFLPDYQLAESLLSLPVAAGAAQQSGLFAKAVDAWIAHELRRGGFEPDGVWPRARQPRVLSRSLVRLLDALPRRTEGNVRNRILAQGTASAEILGEFYMKQVDVVIADWDSGPELMVATKSMLSSYRNNLKNRFEELVGDARNLRGRMPLAAVGHVYVVRSDILEDAGAWEFAKDMNRRLKAPDRYDATCLLVADWNSSSSVKLLIDETPADLRADALIRDLVLAVLQRTPVVRHVEARILCPHFPEVTGAAGDDLQEMIDSDEENNPQKGPRTRS